MEMHETAQDLTTEETDGETKKFIDRTKTFEHLFESGVYNCAYVQYNTRKTYDLFFFKKYYHKKTTSVLIFFF